MTRLTLFYDGHCPLCVAEMGRLAKADKRQQLDLVDINTDNFAIRYPGIDPIQANRTLHAWDENQALLLGLAASCRAWKIVGRRRWMALLRWPLIRPLADCAYHLLARHRYSISQRLTGQKRCTADCTIVRHSRLD